MNRCHKIFLFIATDILFSISVSSQGRLVINNNAFIIIDNSATIVIDNPSSGAISTTGTGGNIVSENENDKIKWNIGNGSGTYVIPFTTSGGTKIPFSMSVSASGNNSGHILFSTYKGPTWNNSTYMPTDVTHMTNLFTGADNSENVIDRFWIVDPVNYVTKPSVSMNFTYADAEHLTAGNTIIESELGAQRFNSTANSWGDLLPAGTNNSVANTVTNVVVSPANFFRSWTLSESSNPLPVELLSYEFSCEGNGLAKLKWSTASETNNDHFILESSTDGIVFNEVKKITGNGTTNYQSTYEVEATSNHYYRLSQVDYNGTTEDLGTLFTGCSDNNEFNMWQSVDETSVLSFSNLTEGNLQWEIYDLSGKLVESNQTEIFSIEYKINLPDLANGIYPIMVKNNTTIKSGKIIMFK